MDTKKKKAIFLIVVMVFQVILLSSCGRETERRPDTQPQPSIETPDIPEDIKRGENQEPKLKVYVKETKKVVEMDMEDYLAGVVAGEMKNDWPIEALSAQAIIARTFVMNFITEKGGSKYEGAHVSTDIEEAQAWNKEEVNEQVMNAVKRTRGKVIVHDGRFAYTWFHAHAGGRTALAKEGLDFKGDEPPYIQPVDSPDSDKAPANNKNWTAEFNKQDVIVALSKVGKPLSDFKNVTISNKGASGRAVRIKFDDTEVSAPGLRIALGSAKMRSTLLENIALQGNKVIIKGKGYGHGVGLSQWGAFDMAEKNRTAEEIIKHYYKNVSIVKMWD